ncbi:MAG: response regulator, partial [Vicinamibacterales bacterium]
PAPIAGLSVLVVDDNEVNRRLIEKTMRRWRAKLTLVETGQKALDAVAAAEEQGEPYTLMLLDGQMPGMDGYEVVRRMRGVAKSRTTLIIMMTSANEHGDAARARDLGIAVHLVKPVAPSDLLRAIGQLLTRMPDHEGAATPHDVRTPRVQAVAPVTGPASVPAVATPPPRRILLAEDNPTNRILALRILERRGHTVTVAENGKEAVDALETIDVELVLMDVQMPVMGGFEATRAIREREKTTGRHLPIIAMTAHAMKGDRERCIEVGMDEYISKPIDSARLLALIDRVAAGAAAEPLPVATPPPPPPSPAPVPASCDVDSFIERVGGDVDLAREMATLFIPDAIRLMDGIREAVAAGHAERLRQEAHALKGAAGNFNATRVVASALDLELMGKSGDLARATAVFATLEADATLLLAALRTFGQARACAS